MPRFSRAALEVSHLLNDVSRWQSGQVGVLRVARAVCAMANAAGENIGLPAAGNDFRPRRIIRWMPIRRKKKIPHLRQRVACRTAGYATYGAIVGHRFKAGWICRIGPRRRTFRALRAQVFVGRKR